MNLPLIITESVLRHTACEIADRLETNLAAVQLVPLKEAARLLSVSPKTAKRLLVNYVELGEATRRYKLSEITALVDARSINSPGAV